MKVDHAREVAEDFEAFFITMFLEPMWKRISTKSWHKQGHINAAKPKLMSSELFMYMATDVDQGRVAARRKHAPTPWTHHSGADPPGNCH